MLQRIKQIFSFQTKQCVVFYGVVLLFVIGLLYLGGVYLKYIQQKRLLNEAQHQLIYLVEKIGSSKEVALANSDQLKRDTEATLDSVLFSSNFGGKEDTQSTFSSADLWFDFEKVICDFQSKAKINDIHIADAFNGDCKTIIEALNRDDLAIAHKKIQIFKILFDTLLQSKPLEICALKILDRSEPLVANERNDPLYSTLFEMELIFWSCTDALRVFLNTLSVEKLPCIVNAISIAPVDLEQSSNDQPLLNEKLDENLKFLTHATLSQFVLKLQAVQPSVKISTLTSLDKNEHTVSSVLLHPSILTWNLENKRIPFFDLFSPPTIFFDPLSNALVVDRNSIEAELEWVGTENIYFPYQFMGWYRHPTQKMPLLFIYENDSKETFLVKEGDHMLQRDMFIREFQEKPFPRVVIYSGALRKDFVLEEGAPNIEETSFILKDSKRPDQLIKLSPLKPSIEICDNFYSLLEYDLAKNELILSKKNLKSEQIITILLTLSKKSFP